MLESSAWAKSKVFLFIVLANNCTACVNILTIEIRWLIVWAAAAAAAAADYEWELQIRVKWILPLKMSAKDAPFTIALSVSRGVCVAGIHNNIILSARVQRPSSISLFRCNKKVSKSVNAVSYNSTLTFCILTDSQHPTLNSPVRSVSSMKKG